MNNKNDSNQGKTALITGASGGIGYELARVFAREGFDLVLVKGQAVVVPGAFNWVSSEYVRFMPRQFVRRIIIKAQEPVSDGS